MSLPWEVEKSSAGFDRAYSVFMDIYQSSKPYTEGLEGTLKVLPVDFGKHGLYM
jgi:hypothetical protein